MVGHLIYFTDLGISRYPVGGLRVIVALLDPTPQQGTAHRVVPVLAALEAERVDALACHRTCLNVLHLDGIVAVRTRTPP